MKIGFLGLGRMGTPMGLRLLAAGHELAVWNRTEERTKPLIHEGAIAAATPAEAELGSDAVLTMLLDDAAYEEVFFGVYQLMDALSPGVLHILCGAISPALAARFTVEHEKLGVDLVAVQVSGSPADAAVGQLSLRVAGSDEAVERARPLLATFSRSMAVVGREPRQAYALAPASARAPSNASTNSR